MPPANLTIGQFCPILKRKGSHGTLFYGIRLTIVQNLNNDLKRATLHTMLGQLDLTLDELLKGKV